MLWSRVLKMLAVFDRSSGGILTKNRRKNKHKHTHTQKKGTKTEKTHREKKSEFKNKYEYEVVPPLGVAAIQIRFQR